VLIMGGMATSTLLTLLVVPVVYDLMDRSVEKATAWSRAARAAFRAPRPALARRAAPRSDRPQ
ncbi:MAG: hypothetical protein F4230_05810, partial [Holophagales bacterium]|nr:hypothetical protein [Holophagales bacterium]